MKFSENWLRQHVKTSATREQLAATLTAIGLEVEDMTVLGASLDGVVVARIVDCARHPEADRLQVCQVDAGTGALLQMNTQVNHAEIAARITPFNRALDMGGAVQRFWNPDTWQGAALLNAEITRQAAIIAYADNFKLMLWLSVLALPLLLITRPFKVG